MACIEKGKCIQGFDGGNLKECGHLEDKGICEKVSLKKIFNTYDMRAWTRLIWFWKGTNGSVL